MSDNPHRTLLVKTTNQLLRVRIPGDAKVTFAAVNPQGRGFDGHALRVYQGSKEGPQLAVFTSVQWFRDVDAIQVQRQVREQRETARHERDGKGRRRDERMSDVNVSWEDADDLPDDTVPF